MARTKRSRRSYGAGEWGRNRVRVFPDTKTGILQIEWRENGRRLTRSLGHREWVKAKRQADEFAAGFASPDLNGKAEAEPGPLTLERLFDIYGEEVTPTKGERARRSDKVAMRTFLQFFGGDRDPATLSQRDWDRFIRDRRAGRIGPSGKPVSDRTIEWDLTFLIAVLNWAERSRDERGRLLLEGTRSRASGSPERRTPPGSSSTRKSTRRCSAWPEESTGGSASRSCSRTRPDTGSARPASSGGRISTSKPGWCGGARGTRRRATNTPRR